ncbi:MAG: hypothetical protein ACI8W8_004698 [Rhodothermales bacterium]|jgi:hypothetical protein
MRPFPSFLIAWCIAFIPVVYAGEILENGDFDDKLEHWSIAQEGAYRVKMKAPKWTRGRGKNAAVVSFDIPFPSKDHYLRLEQLDLDLAAGQIYRLSFDVRGDITEGQLRTACAQATPDRMRSVGLSCKVPVTAEWTPIEIVFQVADELLSSPKPRLHLNLGAMEGKFELRTISLTGPIKNLQPPRKNGTLVTTGLAPKPKPRPRTWRDSKGRSISGLFLRVHNGVVQIESSGRILKVPLESLSAADKRYVAEQD